MRPTLSSVCRSVLLALLLSAVGSPHPAAGADDDCSRGVCQEWWQKDQVNLRRLLRLLEVSSLDVAGLEAAKSRKKIRDDESYTDLGFGATRSLWGLPDGGYLSVRMEVVHYRGELARYRLRMSSLSWPRVRERVMAEWSAPAGALLQASRDGVVVTAAVPAVEAAMREELARGLGPLEAVRVSGRLEAAYSSLMDPAGENIVGTICGFLGMPPSGFEAARRLSAEGRWDLLENVLRGPSAGGRIYAAAALLKRQEEGSPLRPETQEILRRIEALPLEIQTCSGCIVSVQTSAEALALLRADDR